MSNAIATIPAGTTLPAYVTAALAADPSLLAVNKAAAEGIGGGAVPTITANQGMFKSKVDGVETVIQIDVPGMGMMNAPKISAVILAGKPALDRAYFATAYSGAGSEPVSPDCSSEDGIKPKADSLNPQCASCAGCPQNMWGSAKMQDGSSGKGKACAEKKRLAIYSNNGVYRFNVPPATLGDFAAYANQLAAHNLPLSSVITDISFDPAVPTKLVFGFKAILPEAPFAKLQALAKGPEVAAIMQGGASAPAAPAQNQIAAQPAQTGPTAEEIAAKAAADKKAKDAADKKAKAEKAAADKKAKEEAEAAAKAAAGADAGLGIDLGMDLNAGAEGDLAAGDLAVGGGDLVSDEELADLFAV